MAHRARTRTEQERIWRSALNFIVANYERHIKIDDFCKEANISRRSAQRAFAAHNTYWREMVRRCRLQAARELVVSSNRTVKDIAIAVGYRQQAQFANAFRDQFGLTPSRYRNLYKQPVGASS